jgi:AraC family transcriptional regulator, regulatory protein of adaptative response / methylated-DNA-[protein]-cysteine methyltransferase
MEREECAFTGELIQYTFIQSPLGLAAVARSPRGIAAILLGKDRDTLRLDLRNALAGAVLTEDDCALAEIGDAIAAMLAEPDHNAQFALDLRGTPIEMAVWTALQQVPAGTLTTYGALAKRLPLPATAQEVGAACAANRIAVIVPCHRVVKADGGISGYRWGIWRKRRLINLEDLSRAVWKSPVSAPAAGRTEEGST